MNNNYICKDMIDFIVDLFSFEHPGLSYAIDPITAAILLKAGSQAVSSVSNVITGKKDEKEAEERLKELGWEEASKEEDVLLQIRLTSIWLLLDKTRLLTC